MVKLFSNALLVVRSCHGKINTAWPTTTFSPRLSFVLFCKGESCSHTWAFHLRGRVTHFSHYMELPKGKGRAP